ncbi:hypothetical protein BC829DRAFT_446845 [Chytridium lagenaria]|nr:hypothetical protein BC829DRAFT_446845 [Chytridium lagenaria]
MSLTTFADSVDCTVASTIFPYAGIVKSGCCTTDKRITCDLSERRITRLYLASQKLNGTISKELVKLTELEYLSLWGNQLVGRIPSELASLRNLQSLWVDQNYLQGDIPEFVARLQYKGLAENCFVQENFMDTPILGGDKIQRSPKECSDFFLYGDRAPFPVITATLEPDLLIPQQPPQEPRLPSPQTIAAIVIPSILALFALFAIALVFFVRRRNMAMRVAAVSAAGPEMADKMETAASVSRNVLKEKSKPRKQKSVRFEETAVQDSSEPIVEEIRDDQWLLARTV